MLSQLVKCEKRNSDSFLYAKHIQKRIKSIKFSSKLIFVNLVAVSIHVYLMAAAVVHVPNQNNFTQVNEIKSLQRHVSRCLYYPIICRLYMFIQNTRVSSM